MKGNEHGLHERIKLESSRRIDSARNEYASKTKSWCRLNAGVHNILVMGVVLWMFSKCHPDIAYS